MSAPKVVIRANAHGHGVLLVDDIDLSMKVTEVAVNIQGGKMPVVTLTIVAREVDVDAQDAEVAGTTEPPL